MARSFPIKVLLIVLALGVAGSRVCSAQNGDVAATKDSGVSTSADPSSHADATNEGGAQLGSTEGSPVGLFKRFVADQQDLWSSPARIRSPDTAWLVPLGGLAAGLFVTDAQYSKHLSHDPTTISHYNTFSTAGVAALVGGSAGMWLLSYPKHNDHWRETGFLAGEAALNSLVTVEALKYSFQRNRPFQGDGSGQFFQSGGTSFPSEHAALAWSIAGVVAHEYPSPLTQLFAYGLASAVSYSRVHARQHFPSDVLVGSVLGYLISQRIYSRYHDPELGGGEWKSIRDFVSGDGYSSPASQGSPYVPLDSWIYPAFDRLMALGVINSGFAGLRPWTRRECARLLGEALDNIGGDTAGGSEEERIYAALATEFHDELEETSPGWNTHARIESVYSRVTSISGKPLTDGYHFGQTIFNDFGRPYEEGFNLVSGMSGWVSSGPWVAYVRAEYQHAPSAPPLSEFARQTIASVDFIPVVPPATPVASVDRVQLLDAYVGMNVGNWQMSFGRQSLWWGPEEGDPMTFGDNAEPITMFRISRVSPFQLPSFLKFLGPMRAEFFVGQLEGQHFFQIPSGVVGSWTQTPNPQPLINGWKLSLKPTPNLELGLTYRTIYGGVGVPTTPRAFFDALLDIGELPNGASKSSRDNALDFSYRIPKLRKWLTLYGEAYAHDQIVFFIAPKERPLPFGFPDRAAWYAGIYVPRFPRLPKLDFRVEGGYTNNPLGPRGGYDFGFYYAANKRYLNGVTNNGQQIGSWIGRAGQGVRASTNYWLGARSRLQLNFRHLNVGHDYIPQGGSLTDVGARADYWWRSVGFSVWVQHERWLYPVIQPGVTRDWTSAFQISFEPGRLFGPPARNIATNSLDGRSTQ